MKNRTNSFPSSPLLEEPWLEEKYGEKYKEYKASVKRWIGRRKKDEN